MRGVSVTKTQLDVLGVVSGTSQYTSIFYLFFSGTQAQLHTLILNHFSLQVNKAE